MNNGQLSQCVLARFLFDIELYRSRQGESGRGTWNDGTVLNQQFGDGEGRDLFGSVIGSRVGCAGYAACGRW